MILTQFCSGDVNFKLVCTMLFGVVVMCTMQFILSIIGEMTYILGISVFITK